MSRNPRRSRFPGIARRALIVGLTITLLAAMPGASMAAGPSDPFVGSYRAVDTAFDNSDMLLAFGGPDGIRRVIWLDDAGTICGGGRFFAEGVGFVDGNTVFVVLEQYCGSAGNPIGAVVLELTPDPASGTLADSFGIVWSRP